MSSASKDAVVLNEKDINKLTILVDDFDDAIVHFSLEGEIKGYNKGAERLYGYSKDEAIGKPISIFFPENKEKEYCDILYKINNGIYIKHRETLRKRKNGEVILVSISVSSLYDRKGKIVGAICIGRSMEERRKLIDRLKQSEERWRFAIDGGNFGVWDWNIRTNLVYYSDRWKEMLYYEKGDIGCGYEEWINRIHKEDYNYVMDKINKHFNGEEYVVEYRLKCKDNSFKWIRTRGKVTQRDGSGNPVRMTGTNEDIDEDMKLRKKIEESKNRLRGIYDAVDAGIALGEVILDDSGQPVDYKCLHINSYLEKIIGIKYESICVDNAIKILPKNGQDWFHMFNQASLKGKSFKFEDYNKKFDKYFQVNIYSPNPMQFALLVTDITENKRKEIDLRSKYEELQAVYEELTATEEELRINYRELERAHEEVERANKTKSQFLANMSHELRTPLNGILGCTQLLKYTKLNKNQKEDIFMIEDSSNHLLELINDILDLSKIEAGKVELKYKTFNFTEMMESSIKSLTLLAKDKDIEIMYYIDPYINKELSGDILKLKQILNNLFSNAVKFTEHGHIYFKVNQIDKTQEKTKIEFSIEDTGIGISEEFKKDIFNKFTQEENTYNKNYSGTGLGLAISKDLVKIMGGEIVVESEVGKGTKFNFTVIFNNIIEKDCHAGTKKSIKVTRDTDKKHILVVEDNDINSKIVSAFLRKLNYKYFCVHNGKDAIDFLENNKIDIVLMDIQTPILSGYDATKIIRDKEIETKEHKIIIAMTAYAMEGDRKKFIDCGMDDYISKPFDIMTLSEILNKYQ